MKIAIIGAGPAGLMAAEILGRHGYTVDIFEKMPTPARKFLMAGKSGLNITHSEDLNLFLTRYYDHQRYFTAPITSFSPDHIQAWMRDLGSEPFTGSSGRVFPKVMKASPLLRAWIKRLEGYGVRLFTRHDWCGWNPTGDIVFDTPDGSKAFSYDAVILALGGASWQRLGSDGKWSRYLEDQQVRVEGFKPANCAFNVDWSEHLKTNFAGMPVKNICISIRDEHGQLQQAKGDLMISNTGLEGGPVYSLSRYARQLLEHTGTASFVVDLTPDRPISELKRVFSKPRGKKSLSTYLKRTIGLHGAKLALFYEYCPKSIIQSGDMDMIADKLKSLDIPLKSCRPLDEAISSAGGVCFDGLDDHLMIRNMPGVFCAGEMIDWEAPTGGYLITGCFAQGRQAAEGAIKWLEANKSD